MLLFLVLPVCGSGSISAHASFASVLLLVFCNHQNFEIHCFGTYEKNLFDTEKKHVSIVSNVHAVVNMQNSVKNTEQWTDSICYITGTKKMCILRTVQSLINCWNGYLSFSSRKNPHLTTVGSVYVVLPTTEWHRIKKISDTKKRIIELLLAIVYIGRETVASKRWFGKNSNPHGTAIEKFLREQRLKNISYTQVNYGGDEIQKCYGLIEDICIMKSRLFDRSHVKTLNSFYSIISFCDAVNTKKNFSSGTGCAVVFVYILHKLTSEEAWEEDTKMNWFSKEWNECIAMLLPFCLVYTNNIQQIGIECQNS